MRRYLWFLVISAMTLLGLGAVFVWMINPYWMWTVPERLQVVNPDAPRLIPNQRLTKAWQIYNCKPDGLVIGSSRSEWGLDPEHPGWSADRAYNASLAAATLYEMRRYLEHAHAVHELTQVILGLDFFMFDPEEPRSHWNFDERYLYNGKSVSVWSYGARLKAFISIDGWRHARALLRENGRVTGDKTLFMANGQREPTYYWFKDIQPDGHRSAFERSALRLDHEFRRRFPDGTLSASAVEEYRAILRFASDHDIDLRVVLSPVHAWLLEIYDRENAWLLFEEWKRMLVTEAAAVAAEYNRKPFPIWDFADYNRFTTEHVPPAGDAETQMKWYWEVNHYRAELGTLVLNRVFDLAPVPAPDQAPFGTCITTDTVETHLQEVRHRRTQYTGVLKRDLAFLSGSGRS